MRWSRSEIDRLLPILEQISSDLFPVDGKDILVLCSAEGEVAFWLAEMMETGRVTGMELDPQALDRARRTAREMDLADMVRFLPAEKQCIPLPDASIDALVSEFIIYPTTTPTEIGQAEMGRVLKPGGRLLLTDVIVTQPLPATLRQELASIGLDYLCESTQDDFRQWMEDAGMVDIEVRDLTPALRPLWKHRRATDASPAHWQAYSHLLEDTDYALGKGIYYIYVSALKPVSPG